MASKPLTWIMRIGYVTRGIVFLIIGGFALSAAGGFGAYPQGPRDALELLFQKPFGGYLLWGLALGLMCFAVWRLLQAILDAAVRCTRPFGTTLAFRTTGAGTWARPAAAGPLAKHLRETREEMALP